MPNNLLLPSKCKILGWVLLIPATVLGIVLLCNNLEAFPIKGKVFAIFNNEPFEKFQTFSWIETNVTNTTVGILFIVGAMCVGFSKEKTEDEFISKLRLSSLLWAVWVNYFLLFLSMLFIYGTAFLTVMMYNMFTILVIFIARFNYILHKNFKAVTDEK